MELEREIIQLYKKAATSLPEDVERSLKKALAKEKSIANYALSNILKNVDIARRRSVPICQDTGVPVFYVKVPQGTSQHHIKQSIINATRKATLRVPLRPNAVDVESDLNTKDNIGLSKGALEIEQPIIYIEEWEKGKVRIDLLLKGGGSENIGMTYKLPDKALGANRDLEGVKKCIIDAVFKAQGKGCPPYIVGVAVGGAKDILAKESKKQLLRDFSDETKLEEELKEGINKLGIGPLGLGGKTTALSVKLKMMHRHPASFFVDISFNCWACRRATYEG